MRYLIFFLTLIFFQLTYSQTIRVYDKTTAEPVEGIFVFNKAKGFSALSNSNGEVNISGLALSDTLLFRHPSYYVLNYTIENLKLFDFRVYFNRKIVLLDDIIVSVSKTQDKIDELPNKVEIINSEEVEFSNPQTTADMLQKTGGLFIQKSQMGGGSPIIRGFEANKVLMVIDGVRLNNAIYRGGHLQNVITIDNAVLERVEVIFGPGSVIYGSDALGGVMHFYTKQPMLSVNEKNIFKINAYSRYATANNEKTGHFDMNWGLKKIGFFSSFTYSDFDDLRTGNIHKALYPDHGKTFYYAARINDADTMIKNGDVNIQKFTGYSQADVLQKVLFKPNDKIDLTLNFQYSTSSDIPRYDQLNDTSNGELKFSEWYYGPQKRLLTAFQLNLNDTSKFYDHAGFLLAYQKVDEDRVSRKFKSIDRITRNEDVKILSLNIDFNKSFNAQHHLQYGIELTHNDVQSNAFSENINNGLRETAVTRYPDGGSIMQSFAAYLSDKWNIGKKITLTGGVRFNQFRLKSVFIDTTFYQLPFSTIEFTPSSLSGSLGIVYRIGKGWRISLIASKGFRVSNVDDYGKIREKNNQVTVPNDQLKPEIAYNGEFTLTKLFQDKVKVTCTAFYTYLQDMIVRRDYHLYGQDSVLYDGDLAKVQSNINAAKGFIVGSSATLIADITSKLYFKSNINYIFGRDITDNIPLGHIPPVFGQSSIKYHQKKIESEFYIHYHAWKKIEDYAPSGVDNEEEATIDGTPAWYTLNLRISCQINKMLKIQMGLENILDHHYKTFSSGLSAPGRNLIITLRGSF